MPAGKGRWSKGMKEWMDTIPDTKVLIVLAPEEASFDTPLVRTWTMVADRQFVDLEKSND
jgi:hypothetical protein